MLFHHTLAHHAVAIHHHVNRHFHILIHETAHVHTHCHIIHAHTFYTKCRDAHHIHCSSSLFVRRVRIACTTTYFSTHHHHRFHHHSRLNGDVHGARHFHTFQWF